ncbi:hypothetical protein Dimus_031340, partial [Dionaea muscipula]
ILLTFDVPLNDKEAEQAVKTDYYDETFLGMCQLRRKNGVWWLGSGVNRRRDEVEHEEEGEEETEEKDEETNSEKTVEKDKAARSTPAGFEWERIEGEQPEQSEKEAVATSTETAEDFFDAEDGGKVADVNDTTPVTQPGLKKTGKSTARGVDPSGTIPDYDLIHLQVEFDRALKANTRFQELLQQIKPKPLTSPRHLAYLDHTSA